MNLVDSTSVTNESQLSPSQGAPLRVALVSSSSGSRGGGELYLVSLARGLSELGHEVQSVLAEHSRMDELAGLLVEFGSVRRIPYTNTYDRRLRSLGAVLARREIGRLAAELRLDADIIHLNKQNLEDGLDLLAAVEMTGLPAVATVHVTRTMQWLNTSGGLVRDWVARRALRTANCPLIAIAESGIADLSELGINRERLRLVWNGVSNPAPIDRDAVRQVWGCGPQEIVLGCVARLEPQKNPLFMISLLPQLPANVRLVWVGDGSLMEAMRAQAEALGVLNRVILPGWQHDARSLMEAFDLFVLPSIYEGFPFAILEAMAAGLPCVVSDVDGVGEAVVDGSTGFVCPPNGTDVWLNRLGQYLTDRGALQRAGALARSRYLENFSLEVMAKRTANVYRDVLSSRLDSRRLSRGGTPAKY
jgi:glycosyltransferase involved in cell wall biosynthesis